MIFVNPSVIGMRQLVHLFLILMNSCTSRGCIRHSLLLWWCHNVLTLDFLLSVNFDLSTLQIGGDDVAKAIVVAPFIGRDVCSVSLNAGECLAQSQQVGDAAIDLLVRQLRCLFEKRTKVSFIDSPRRARDARAPGA